MSRKEGGRGLNSIKVDIDTTIQGLDKKSERKTNYNNQYQQYQPKDKQ